MLPRATIEAFDQHLIAAGLRLEAVVIGGSALALLGLIHRETRDFDVLAPELPAAISSAAKAFAAEQRKRAAELIDDWLNNGPKQLTQVLPKDWRLRVRPLLMGTALILDTLGRADLLKTNSSRCATAAPTFRTPTASDLAEALPWVVFQDANPDWPPHVEATLNDLKKRLAHRV